MAAGSYSKRKLKKPRPDGIRYAWSVVIPAPRDEGGRRRRHRKSGFRTKEEAQVYAAGKLKERQDGSWRQDHSGSFIGFLRDWLAAQEASGTRKPKTLESYRSHIEIHIAQDRIAKRLVAKLTASELDAFYARLLKKPTVAGRLLSPKTITNVATTVSAALAWGVKKRVLVDNVARNADRPKTKPASKKILTEDDLRRLLNAAFARNELDALALRVLAVTGARRGEVLGARWDDLDWDEAELHIRQSVSNVGTRIEVGTPKTASGRRIVPLDSETLRLLTHWREQQPRAIKPGEMGHLVFSVDGTTPMNPSNFTHRIRDLAASIGLDASPHTLRHTAATHMVRAGTDIRTVAEILGHSKVSVTLDMYGSSTPEWRREGVEVMAAIAGTPL